MDKNILAMKSIAYYSGLNGVEIKKIESGIEDYVLCVSGAWGSKKRTHRVKVNYAGNPPYFKIDGKKIHLDQCIRM